MKLRYIIAYYVDAESIEEALKKAKRMKPHEVYIHNSWWEKNDFKIKEDNIKEIGFKSKKSKR